MTNASDNKSSGSGTSLSGNRITSGGLSSTQTASGAIQTPPPQQASSSPAIYPVALKCYDLSKGFAQMMGPLLLGIKVEAVWHTGVLCHGTEFFYGGGIQMCAPDLVESTYDMNPLKIIELGTTNKSLEQIKSWCLSKQERFSDKLYNLTRWNCNHFSNELCKFLFDKAPSEFGIPVEIVKQVEIIAATPGGATIISGIQLVQDQMMKYDNIFTGVSLANVDRSSGTTSATTTGTSSLAPRHNNDDDEEPDSPESGFEPVRRAKAPRQLRPAYESLSLPVLEGDNIVETGQVDIADFFAYLKVLWDDGNIANEQLFTAFEFLSEQISQISEHYNSRTENGSSFSVVKDINVEDENVRDNFLSLPGAIPILSSLGFTLIEKNGHEIYHYQRQISFSQQNGISIKCAINVLQVLIHQLVDIMTKN